MRDGSREQNSTSQLRKTVLASLFLVIAIVWAAGAHLVLSSRAQHLEHAGAESENLNKALAAYMAMALSSVEHELKELASLYPADFDTASHGIATGAYLESLADDGNGATSYNVVRKDGLMERSSGARGNDIDVLRTEVFVGDQEYFKYFQNDWPRRANDIYVGRPIKSRLTDNWIIPIARPRLNHDGKFPGVVLASMRPDRVLDFYKNFALSGNQTISIYRGDGILLASLPYSAAQIGKDFSSTALFSRELKTAGEGYFEAEVPSDNTVRLVAYKKLPGYPVVVAVSRLKHAVLMPWRGQAMVVLAVIVLITLVLGLFTMTVFTQTRSVEFHERNLQDAVRDRTTELLLAKEEAELANRTKDEFLANMSHELRTPLNSVIGFSEMMMMETWGALGNAHYKDYVESISESGRHLLEVINDILDISKIEAHKMDLEEETIDVAATVAKCIRMVGSRATEKSVLLISKVPQDLPPLTVDKTRFKQVLVNIIGNSIKFTHPHGVVSIEGEFQADGSLRVSVRDDGVGIPKSDLARVLQPFEQSASAHSRNHEGSGLGLPLSKRLMEMHDGALTIESELEKGTAVHLIFPPYRVGEQSPAR